jgi:hypothetical protein
MALPRSSKSPSLAGASRAAAGDAAWHGAREPEQTWGTSVAKNTMQPGTHVDSITGEIRGQVGPWYQLVHNNAYVLFILSCASATLKFGKGAAFIG